jgi:hypothetical protein
MNCAECGLQTDVSAPGAGTATAKHHRDMMSLLWPNRPRPRANRHSDPRRDRFPVGSLQTNVRTRRNLSVLGLPAASTAISERPKGLGRLMHVSVLSARREGVCLLTDELLSGNLVLTFELAYI